MQHAELDETSMPFAAEICLKIFLYSVGIIYTKAFFAGVSVIAQGML